MQYAPCCLPSPPPPPIRRLHPLKIRTVAKESHRMTPLRVRRPFSFSATPSPPHSCSENVRGTTQYKPIAPPPPVCTSNLTEDQDVDVMYLRALAFSLPLASVSSRSLTTQFKISRAEATTILDRMTAEGLIGAPPKGRHRHKGESQTPRHHLGTLEKSIFVH